MIESNRCSAERINGFLRQELSDTEQRELERHLDTCSHCRSHLDQSTADRRAWSEASDFLRDEPFDLERLRDLCDADSVEGAHPHVNFDIQQIIGLLAPTDDPDRLGRIGRYEVAGVIGSGGMGIVLKAFDSTLNRFVAIKLLAPHLASTAAARKRFQREAQAAAAVVHENVLAIHGVDTANGLPYLVMPYIRGISLEGRIHQKGALPLIDVLRIGMQTAAGLSAAHAQGLVHRDIKPSNILLTDGAGRVAITDFGLARAVDDASLTRTGMIAGTPQYMSPEQARGDDIGHHSDLFSLGSVLYAMCTGRPPFRAETSYAVLRRITDTEPHSIRDVNPEIPDWLAALIAKLHRKCPAERPASANEVARLLERCLAHVQQPTAIDLPDEVIALTRPSGNTMKGHDHRGSLFVALAAGSLVMIALFLGAIDFVVNRPNGAPIDSQTGTHNESPPTEPRTVPSMGWDPALTHDLELLTLEMTQLESELDSIWPQIPLTDMKDAEPTSERTETPQASREEP